MHSDLINEIAQALAKAQGQMKAAHKDGANPHLKNKYATLSSIIETVREPLSSNALAFSQILTQGDEGLILKTILMHGSGQWIQSEILVSTGEGNRAINEAQALGSALTYYKRYALAAMLGISVADEDDDGNGATDQQPKRQPTRRDDKPAPPSPTQTKPNGNGQKLPGNPQQLFDAVQGKTGSYYKNTAHLYQVLKSWPDFNDQTAIKIALDVAIDHAQNKAPETMAA